MRGSGESAVRDGGAIGGSAGFGWAGGYGFAALVVQGFSTDVVALPLVVNRQTFAYASLIALATALAAALIVRRRLDRIDIVQALKARD